MSTRVGARLAALLVAGIAGTGTLLAAGLAGTAAAEAGVLPAWAARAAARPTPSWAARDPAIVLDDEEEITVPVNGRIRTLVRGAVRVLSASGKESARCYATYLRGSSDVLDLQGWVADPRGRVLHLGRGDATDFSLGGQYTLYSESRALMLTPADPVPGTVFAWEYVTEEEPLLAQWEWWFQGRRPSLYSRLSLTLPPGLEPEVIRCGPDSVVAARQDRTWSWERSDLRAAPLEALASTAPANGSVLLLTVKGAASHTAAGQSFADWSEVARWANGLMAPQAQATPALGEWVAKLVAGAPDTLARLRALARAVQGLNYVAVDLNVGRGGGYRPHPAGDVMRLGYGDCKDKANLLRALVQADGEQAWMVVVSARDRDHVDERWPSPTQFDHCILAMRVPRGTRLPTVFEHPVFGTLLAFDPTAQLTSFGDLPAAEQGAPGLLVAPQGGGLVRLPVVPPEANRLERRIDATLDAEGKLTARLVERCVGQQAVGLRGARRRLSETDYRRGLESDLSASVGSVQLGSFRTDDDTLTGSFRLEASYVAPRFARDVQGQLVFRSALATPPVSLDLPDSERTMPMALEARCVAETVLVELPGGYAVDELPDARHVHRDFADLDADWHVEGGTLRYTMRWSLRPLTLPPARYREVREMLAGAVAAGRAPVVLVRR